jgi:hypothetical protein
MYNSLQIKSVFIKKNTGNCQHEFRHLISPNGKVLCFDQAIKYIGSTVVCGPGSVVGIATGYELDGPGIEYRWRRDFPHLSRPALEPNQLPAQWVPGLSRSKERPGRDADPSPPSSAVVMKTWTYTSTPPMGHTVCTEPQCLYKGVYETQRLCCAKNTCPILLSVNVFSS